MQSRVRKFVILFTVVVSLCYLAYRIGFTLNLTTTYATFISIALIAAETFGIASVVLFALQVWDPKEPEQKPVLPGRTVDVFVPTYNEDPAILRATIEAATRLDYPGVRIHLCDDGGTEQRTSDPEKGAAARERADELKAICAELGAEYRTRPKNVHAKAGNLNYAFAETDGEFIIILDADHAPEPHFVSRLIGYFADEKLGYIQTPHAFYNFESFQSKLDHTNRKYWEEGALFYGVIQPGRNRWNCPIFAGSAAMFRRKALEEVGYIALETITEDMHTGMRMNSKGWKALGISERMIVGQAAPDITTFHVQRLRWGEGNLSIIFYDNPLTMKGLTLAQRFCYLGSMLHWAGGLFKLIIYLTPVLMMLTGVSPVAEFTWTLFAITAVYIAVSLYGVRYASNGYGSILYGELFAMVNFWTQIRGTMRAVFWRKFQQFVVTSKRGRQSNSIWPFVRPQIAIFALSFFALTWGWGRVLFGISDDWIKPLIPTGWLLFHMTLVVMAVRRALTPESGRYTFRHAVNLPVRYQAEDDPETNGVGVTADLSEQGVGIVAYTPLAVGDRLRLTIAGAGESVRADGTVAWCRQAGRDSVYGTRAYRVGVKIDPLPGKTFDAVNRITLQYAVPRLYIEYGAGNRHGFMAKLAQRTYRRLRRWRVDPDRTYHVPVVVTLPDGTTAETVTEQLTPTSTAVLLSRDVHVGDEIGLTMVTPVGTVVGRAKVDKVRHERIGAKPYVWVGAQFLHLEGDGSNEVQELVSHKAARGLASALRPEPKPMPVPVRKPLIAAGLAASLLIGAQFLSFPVIYSQEIFLREIASADRPLTPEEKTRFNDIYKATLAQDYPSTDKLVLLMEGLAKVNPADGGLGLTATLAQRDRSNLDLQKAWADVLDQQKDYAAAEARYQQLLARQDAGELTAAEYRELLLAAARSAVHAGDPARATARFEQYLGQYPDDIGARDEYAGFLISQEKYAAVPDLYAGFDPDYDGHLLLMSAYALAGDYVEAEAQSREVLALRPGDKKAEKLLADILNKKQNTIQAQQIYERLAAQAGSDPAVRVRLGQVYLLQHDFTRAMDQFRLAMAADITGDEVDHGFIDAAAGAPESAMTPQVKGVVDRVYAETQTEAISDPVFLARLGWVMERFKEFDKSAGLLERAVALKPTDVDLRKQLFGVLVARGEMDKALAMFSGDQNDPGIRRMLVDAYLRAGDMPSAAREAGKLHAAEPADIDAARLYADILSWNGQYDESLAVFEQLSRQLTSDPEIPLRIAEVTLWSGRPDQALGLYQGLLSMRFDRPKVWEGFIDAAAGSDELTLDQFKLAVRIGRQPSVMKSENPALLSRLAWVMVRENHPEMAEPFLTRAVELKPAAPGEKRELAGVLAAADRPADALTLYDGLKPLTADDYLRLTDIHTALKQFDEAEADVKSYLADKPGDPKGERLLADVLSWKGNYPAALAAFRHLLAVDPTNLELRIRYAETTLWSRDTAEALTLFSRLIAENPSNHRVLEGFVNAASGADKLSDAQKALVVKVADETDFAPDDAALLGRLAWVFHQAGLTKEATAAADKAVALDPQDVEVRKQLGGVLAAIGRFDASLQMFAELALGPKDRLELARVYAAIKNFPAAEKEVREFLKTHPEAPDARRQLADILAWKGEFADALTIYHELAAERPDDQELPVKIAETNLWAGRPTEALGPIAASLEAYLDQPELWPLFVDAAAAVPTLTPAQRALAVRVYLKLDVAKWDDVGRLARLGKLLVKLGRTVDADAVLTRAVALQPADDGARRELAWALADIGRTKDGIALFQDVALTIDDRKTLAGLAARTGDYAAAEEQYRTLLAADPDNPELTLELAGVLVGAKAYPAAFELFNSLIERSPDDLDLALRVGQAMLAAGRPDEALTLFTRVLGQRFDDTDARHGFVNAAATVKVFTSAQARLASRLAADPELLKSTDPTYLSRLAWVLVRERIDGPLNPILDRAVALLPNDLAVKREVAGVLAAAGRAREALALFGTGVENTEDRYELANIYASLKEFAPAVEQARLYLEDEPDSRKGQRLLADLLSWSGEFDEALVRFEKLRRDDPDDQEIPIRIAETTLWAYRPQEALERFTRILAGDPDQPRVVPGFVAAAFECPTVPPASLKVADAVRGVVTATREEVAGPAGLGGGLVAAAMIADRTDPLVLARLGYVLHRAGQTELAARLFDKAAAAIQPQQTGARSEVGTILAIAGDTAAADRLRAGLPFDAEEKYRAARIYAAVKDFPEAIRITREIVAKEPTNRKAERLLADSLTWNREYDAGLTLLRKLLRETPDDPDLPARIAQTLVWANRPKQALVMYEAELRKHSNSPKLVRGLFEAAAAAGELTTGQIDLVVKTYGTTPIVREITDPEFLASLGRALQLAGKADDAVAFLDRAAAADPLDPDSRRTTANLLAEAGRSERALQLLSGPDATPDDYIQLAYVFSGRQDFAAAEKAAREYLKTRSGDAKAERLLADVLSWKGDFRESLTLYDKLAKADPDDETIPVRIAEITLWSKEFVKAASEFDRLLAAGSDAPAVRAGFAAAVAAIPDPSAVYIDRAEALAAKMTPAEARDHPLTAGRLAVILVRGKKPAGAAKLAEPIAQADPTDEGTRRELAGILSLLGQRKRATELLAGLELTPSDRLNLAGLYASADDFTAAEKEYRAVLAESPNDPAAVRRLAELLSWKKEYKESIHLYDQLLTTTPDDPELRTRLAEVRLWSGDYSAAAAEFYRLVKSGTTDLPVVVSLTAAVANADPIDPAIERAVVALSDRTDVRESKDVMFLGNMAWVLHRAGDNAGAEKYLDAALATDPVDPAVRKNLAGVLEVAGRTKEALKMFEGLVLTPADRFRLAGLFAADKRYGLAVEQCRAILADEPKNVEARRLLANALSWDGKFEESLALFRELQSELPADPEIPVRIAEVTLWDRQYDAAVKLYRTLLTADFTSPRLWPGFVDALASADTITDADTVLAGRVYEDTSKLDAEELASMYPNDPTPPTQLPSVFLSRLAWVMSRSGDKARTNALLERVLARTLIEPEARKELAGVLSSVGRFREAIAMFNTVELTATDRIQLAQLHIADNDFPTAERKLRELVRADPMDVSLKLLLGDVLIWTRQYTEALRTLAEARRLRPDDPAVLGRYATASVYNKDPETALAILDPLLEADLDRPELWQPYLDAVAASKTVDPKFRQTVESIVEQVDADRADDPSRYVSLGLALGRVGQGDRAVRMMAAAVAESPDNEQLRFQFANLLSRLGRYDQAEDQYRMIREQKRRERRAVGTP